MTDKPAFTIVSIKHPDELRAPETRYTVNSYTHRHTGRRPKKIALKKQLAVSWTKSREDTPDESISSGGPPSVDADPSQCDTRNSAVIASPSPLTIEFTGTRRDPFNSYPIEVRGCVEGAVDFWLKEWTPAQIPGMTQLLPKPIDESPKLNCASAFLDGQPAFTGVVISRMFGLAMSNAETFQSLVALSQAIREYMLGRDVAEFISPEVLYHKGIALHTLSLRLNSQCPVDETMMLTVLNLLALDLIRFESTSFRLHLSALRQMSTQPNAFKTDLQKQIFLGYLDASKVYLQALEYSENKHHPDRKNVSVPPTMSSPIPAESSMTLPPGFRALALEGQLSLGLTSILARFSVWIELVNDSNVSKNTAMFMKLRPWVDIENQFPILERERTVNPPSTEKLVCLSLFCLACYILRRFSLSGIFHRMLADLMGSIKDFQPRDEWQVDLKIWATTLAAGIGNERPSLAYRSAPLVDSVIDSLPNPFGMAQPEYLFRQFLADEHSLKAWSACWTAGLGRKKLRLKT
ncbi:hypothetical protein LTR84_012861 [Exophiala bonariae]|uniref:Transcription factor domain-containing protein n=1 Tax=Exophiala bonariae TaxID=1690606 RepID=A0AAV9NDD4_9EURO|nr:hypothetical protein LTR84_012861 [Exophiala bonariae]